MSLFRLGIALLELIVSMVIALTIMVAVVVFFSGGYKQAVSTMKTSEANLSIMNVVEIIDSDLRKAGYGSVSKFGLVPVSGVGSYSDPLTIYYVDYTRPGCDNQKWDTAPSQCRYKIEYYLSNNNIVRRVFENATGAGLAASLFDSNIVKVTNFKVAIDTENHIVSYTISGKERNKDFKVNSEVICRNW